MYLSILAILGYGINCWEAFTFAKKL